MTTFTIILSLLSGVALFLFGMSLMGDGLKKVAGNKLELVLYKLTNTPLKGVLLGTACFMVGKKTRLYCTYAKIGNRIEAWILKLLEG